MTADPIGDALRADAEAARAEIRAAGLICPSCGVNMADLPEDHLLTLTHGRQHENAPIEAPTAKCEYGPLVMLGEYETIRVAANISLYDQFRKAEAAAFDRIVGTGPANFTGLLDAL